MPRTLGTVTHSVIVYGPESHKLFLEFEKDDATVIEPGNAVVMDASNPGEVLPAVASVSHDQVVGYAVTGDNHTAYGTGKVTVACKGYMVAKGIASADITPGPVEWNGNSPEGKNQYLPSTDPGKTCGIAITGGLTDSEIHVMLF